MEHNFHKIFHDIVKIMRTDYAGIGQCEDSFTPKYYTQAIGQGWNDGVLDELLFLRYVNQMLACTGDRHLKLSLLPGDGYEPYNPGFFARRYGDALYVTEATQESRLRPGDCITAINGGSPAQHRSRIQKNFFYADDPEREDWGALLKMAETIDVDGIGTIQLQHYPQQNQTHKPSLRLIQNTAVIAPGSFDGSGSAARLVAENQAAIINAQRIVWDMRCCDGQVEEDFFPLLDYLCTKDSSSRELLGTTDIYVNYSPRNCAIRAAALQGLTGAENYIQELREKAGRGLVPEYDEGENRPIQALAKEVIVLTDTWCRDAGEAFALAAKRAGARLVGRPTMGTLDYCGDLQLLLDERYIFTWPSAITREALNGHGIKGKGIAPDTYIPFTPDEIKQEFFPGIIK